MCLQSAGHKPQKVDAMSPPVCGWIVSVRRGPFNVLRLKESHNGNGSNECAVHMRSHFVVAENLQTKLSCARSPSKGVLFCVLFRSAPPKAGHVEFVAFAACWLTPVTALSSAEDLGEICAQGTGRTESCVKIRCNRCGGVRCTAPKCTYLFSFAFFRSFRHKTVPLTVNRAQTFPSSSSKCVNMIVGVRDILSPGAPWMPQTAASMETRVGCIQCSKFHWKWSKGWRGMRAIRGGSFHVVNTRIHQHHSLLPSTTTW